MRTKKIKINIKKATLNEAKVIQQIINQFAKENKMLMRSLQYICEHIREFIIAVNQDEEVVGSCAFSVSYENMAEIKSLAVKSDYQRRGIASRLIKKGVLELKKIGVKKVFCLTYVPEFFLKLNYAKISKEELPHKIWTECINCAQFPNCNETALIKNI